MVEKQTTTTLSYVLTTSIRLQKTLKTKWKNILQMHSWIVTTLRKGFRSQENSTVSMLKQKHLHMYRCFDLNLVYHFGNFSNPVELNTSRSLLLYLPSGLGHKLVIWKIAVTPHNFLASSYKCHFFSWCFWPLEGGFYPWSILLKRKTKCCSRV